MTNTHHAIIDGTGLVLEIVIDNDGSMIHELDLALSEDPSLSSIEVPSATKVGDHVLPFVSCVRSGTSLICTPWGYTPWGRYGQGGGGVHRGASVELAGVFQDKPGVHAFVSYKSTLEAVCELVGADTKGRALVATVNGGGWALDWTRCAQEIGDRF